MTQEAQPQNQGSGLVERTWVRTSRRAGQLTERTREGETVAAAWIDRQGHLRRAAGTVIRNDAGELVIESRADGVRQEAAVPRDANVDAVRRPDAGRGR
jgi:hypothetical protein